MKTILLRSYIVGSNQGKLLNNCTEKIERWTDRHTEKYITKE